MRIVFAGTPDFAVPSLRALIESGVEIPAVYTQPDRPAGRGRKLQASPVKALALAHRLPVMQPKSLRNEEQAAALRNLSPDLLVVTAYGLILPQAILDAPRLGCVNVHASLLPRWRGAAPIQRAIEAGDRETGITLMRMEAGLDTGPMLAQLQEPIREEDTGGSLHDRLAELGGEALRRYLPALLAGELEPVAQDESLATYAAKLTKSETPLDWSLPAPALADKVRAFDPWPVATTHLDGIVLRLLAARAEAGDEGDAPGTVLAAGRGGIVVQTGDGRLVLTRLQKPGGKPLSAGDFLNGVPIAPGQRFTFTAGIS